MKVLYMPCDFDGSGTYRAIAPARELKKRGHECIIPPYTLESSFENGGKDIIHFTFDSLEDADVYFLQRRLEPEWTDIARELRALGKVVVAETDDWFLGLPSYNPASIGTRPWKKSYAIEYDKQGVPFIAAVKKERRMGTRDNLHSYFRESTLLTVTTNFLGEQYSRFNPNVRVIPNYLDWRMWENVTPQYEVERDRIRVGWMGSLTWRKGDLSVLRGLLGPFLRRHPEVDFVAAGDDDERVHDFLEVPEDQRITYGRAGFHDLPKITAVMDIGLIPLEMNNFNEAKSDLKGKEYAACGVPCIASPTESYRGWVDEGENGFLARKPRQWLSHLEALVSDDSLRRIMGKRARDKALRHTIQDHVGEWEEAFLAHVGESESAEGLFASLP